MAGVVVTDAARRDLCELIDFIALDDDFAAERVYSEISDALEVIAERPEIGHRHVDIDQPGVRVWNVKSWLIVDRADRRPVVIVRVLRGSRDIGGIV